MLRSPIFFILVLILLISCQEKRESKVLPDDTKKEVSDLQKKAIDQLQKNNFNSAFYYFNKSNIAAQAIQDSADVIYNLIQMAYIQQTNGDYYGSKETLTTSLPYLKKKDIYSASINNFFGIANKELSIYEDAIRYYKEALKDCEDEISKNGPLNNIAVVYIKQEKYDKAIAILESILKKGTLDGASLKQNKARVIDNLGYAYFKKGTTQKGLELMTEGYDLRNQINDYYGSLESNLHLAEFYKKITPEKSQKLALDAYHIATKFKNIDERLKALSFLISNSRNGKNDLLIEKFIFLNDSITQIRNNYKNKFAKIRYDSKKVKIENQLLRVEKVENLLSLQKIKYQRLLFISGIIFLIISIAVITRYFRIKNKNEKIKAAHDTETLIAKKIHDELANDVFHLLTFAQTQPLSKEHTKENLLQKLDDIYIRIRGISREYSDIDTKTNYELKLKELFSPYNSSDTNIILTKIDEVNWAEINETKKVILYRVLQELMVNMKKHSEASLVLIKFDNSDPKKLIIDYVDNGKGSTQAGIIKNGLQNMENRAKTVDGSIVFITELNKGFKAKITLPK